MIDQSTSTPPTGLGARIRAARKARKLSQPKLAEALGVSSQAVGQWESGATRPTSHRLEQLAAVLDKSLVWLLTGTGDESADDDVIRMAVAALRASGADEEPGALDSGLIALAAITTFDRLKAIDGLAASTGREFWRECVANYQVLRDALVEFGSGEPLRAPSSSDD